MDFHELYFLVLFFFALYVLGDIVFGRILRTAPLIGHIIVGTLFVSLPGDKIIKETNTLELLGGFGILLCVFEGGHSLDLKVVRKTAVRAISVATVGIVTPCILCYCTMRFWFKFSVGESVSSASALASTSVAISLTIMREYHMLTSRHGCLITTAAMFDDVVSLVLLAVITQVFREDAATDPFSLARPAVASIGTLIIGGGLAYFMPGLIRRVKPHLVRRSESLYHEVLLGWMVVYGAALSFLAEYAGTTKLLGVFLAGCSFAMTPEAHEQWEVKMGPVERWLSSIFFASIGFIVPVHRLFLGRIIGWGLAYTVIASFGKFVSCTVSRLDHKLLIGFAMIARGELGLVLVKQAFDAKIMGQDAVAVTCWAVVLCTFGGAVGFSTATRRMVAQIANRPLSPNESDISEDEKRVDIIDSSVRIPIDEKVQEIIVIDEKLPTNSRPGQLGDEIAPESKNVRSEEADVRVEQSAIGER